MMASPKTQASVDAFAAWAQHVGSSFAPDVWQSAAHDGAIASMRAQEGEIPKLTGALAASLLRRNDRAHVWEVQSGAAGWQVRLGSRLVQAYYQRHRLPAPRPEVIGQYVMNAIARHIEGGTP